MKPPHGAQQYHQTAIKTANRGQLLLILYEAAIQNTRKAILAIQNQDRTLKGRCIGKTHDILNELLNTLDFEIGGTIAQDLSRLYQFMIEQLVKANAENSVEPLEITQKLLETLLDAWRQAVADVNQGIAKDITR